MDMPTEQTLYRKYLTKINPELRVRVLSKEWKIDGDVKPARMPTTHKEIARAVGLLLEEKADIHATGLGSPYDALMMVSGGPYVIAPNTGQGNTAQNKGGSGKRKFGPEIQCEHCQAQGEHYTMACPQKAADTRGDTAGCLKNAKESGAACSICRAPGH